ncbi:MAG TPA: signal peptidase I [Candidatus Angelobacter sp.]|nr:signal peptidase I [Candidatus Angelobacter sp.]
MHARKTNQDQGTGKKPEKKKETVPESIAGFAEVLVSGLFIITFVMGSFVIPSGSMEQTLLVGDHLFVDRLTPAPKTSYTGPVVPYRQVHRGDIVVFIHPDEKYQGQYVVKRIIGAPGDRIHLRNGEVYRNGEKLNEPYRIRKRGDYIPYRDEFPALSPAGVPDVSYYWPLKLHESIQGEDLVVPPGNYFGMGDNREESLDSRYWGFIPQENIVGRPLFIYWSFVTPHDEYERTTMAERASFLFYQIVHFFDKTRWNRTFRRVK